MADKKKISIKSLKDFASQKAASVDLQTLKENAVKAGDAMNERAGELKNSAMAIKDDVANKLNELDRMLEDSITEYNDAYTLECGDIKNADCTGYRNRHVNEITCC